MCCDSISLYTILPHTTLHNETHKCPIKGSSICTESDRDMRFRCWISCILTYMQTCLYVISIPERRRKGCESIKIITTTYLNLTQKGLSKSWQPTSQDNNSPKAVYFNNGFRRYVLAMTLLLRLREYSTVLTSWWRDWKSSCFLHLVVVVIAVNHSHMDPQREF